MAQFNYAPVGSDFNAYQENLQNYNHANPFTGDATLDGYSPAANVGGWGPDRSSAAENWQGQNYTNWLSSLPDKGADYLTQMHQHYAANRNKGRMAALLAAGGIVGAGALGAGGLGGMFGGAGADAATSAAWGSGAGLGGDTLSAMGVGQAAGGAAGAGGFSTGISTIGEPGTLSSFFHAPQSVAAGYQSPMTSYLSGAGWPGAAGAGTLGIEQLPTQTITGSSQAGAPDMQALGVGAAGSGLTTGDFTRMDRGSGYSSSNPIMDFISKQFSSPQSVGRMGSNLLDMYNNYQKKKRNQGMINNLSSLYGPNSPYAQQLNKALTRAYAASGRRSDVGGRNVELQARLAAVNAQLAPTLNTLNNQQGAFDNGFLNNIVRFGDQSGLTNKIGTSLASLWGG